MMMVMVMIKMNDESDYNGNVIVDDDSSTG